MIPIRDDNPTHRFAFLTAMIIAGCVYVFFMMQPATDAQAVEYLYARAAIPCEVLTGDPLSAAEITGGRCQNDGDVRPVFPEKSVPLSIVESMFMHANLIHLASNMWILWIFGNNVEDRLGRGRYVLFYLGTGVVATFAHVAFNASSTIPVIGASGAIAGVMGAYLVMFPTARVVSVIPPFFFIPFRVPAAVFLLLWAFAQFSISATDPQVAWIAHVGGFGAGALYALATRRARGQRR
ncbi:MAG TPA: rhomboid family intramembrane serine protease [Acidimicrobiia bacterium]